MSQLGDGRRGSGRPPAEAVGEPANRSGLRTALLATFLVLAALALRLPNLGGPSFEVDEILHVHSASSLLEGEAPTLPGGHEYRRALGYTRLVALSGGLFGLDERSARLPGVFFGAAVPLLLFFIGRCWYSARVGLVAAVVAAIFPSQLVFSRMVRMYAPFQLLFLALLFLLFYLLEPGSRPLARSSPSDSGTSQAGFWMDRLLVAVLTILCFLLASHLHTLVIPAMLGPLSFLTLRALQDLATAEGGRRQRLYRLLALGLLAAGTGVHFLRLGGLENLIATTEYAPGWAAAARGDHLFYFRALSERLSEPVLLLAVAGVALSRGARVQTVYLACCLVLPLLLQSHLFAWKAYRYIFHLLPILYLLFAAGLDSVVRGGLRLLRRGWPGLGTGRRTANWLVITALIGLVAWAGWPGQVFRYLGSTVSVTDGIWHNSWREALAVVAAEGSGGEPLITTKPLLAAYYGGERDLYMANNRVSLRENPRFGAGGGEVRTLEEVLALLDRHQVVWLVCERWLFYDEATIPGAVADYFRQHGRRSFVPQAADMVIVRLQRASSAGEGSPPPGTPEGAV